MTKLLLTAVMSLLIFSTSSSAAEVDTSPLNLVPKRVFENIKFERPIVLTHANDSTDRVFIASQLGLIHVLPNDRDAETTTHFLDMRSKVTYKNDQNEEGLLGMAFHPKYKENGEFFVYYTTSDAPQTSIVSRFRVSKDDPNKADPKFEEEILRVQEPYWNHNGGTIVFGPDGYLYIALGDGGSGNDPHMNGQNLQSLLGSILRIDIDHKTPKNPKDDKSVALAYAIPKDNPFVKFGGLARGEIWAYGLRNVWRMSFDPQTGTLWAGDVGQKLWEEINLIVRGGNYGWNLREAKHKFGPRGSDPRKDLIDPIWEYHHEVGKSITGGNVYRGKRCPKLQGAYVYADYVTGKIWALWYDTKTKKVTANRPILGNQLPLLSFGEDQHGELYFMTDFGRVHTFEKK